MICLSERLSSKLFLVQRGIIQIEDSWCHHCRSHIEDSNHIIIHCDLALRIWMLVLSRWGVTGPLVGNVTDLIFQWDFLNKSSRFRSLWNILAFEIAWALWINRNKAIFYQESYLSKSARSRHFFEACRQSFWWAKNNIKDFGFTPSDLLAVPTWGNL